MMGSWGARAAPGQDNATLAQFLQQAFAAAQVKLGLSPNT